MKKALVISKDESIKGTIKSTNYVAQELSGVEVFVVQSYEEAENSIKEKMPELIICDVDIDNEYDGLNIINRIYLKYKISTILIANSTNSQVLEHTQGIKLVGFITKPILIKQLKINLKFSLNA